MSPPGNTKTRNGSNNVPDCATLAGMIGNLKTDIGKIKNGEYVVPNMSDFVESIKQHVLKELDHKFEIVISEYDQKLERAKTELNIKLESDANATVRAVTGFFSTLDAKVTELKINMDVYEEKMAVNKDNIEKLAKEINQWSDTYSESNNSNIVEREHDAQSIDFDKLYQLEKRFKPF